MTDSANTDHRAVPLVSICVITYRHAKFITQCIETMLAQRTPFPFEIIIGDDGSDDGTREICQALAAAHPERIRLLLHSRKDVTYVDGRPRGTRNFVATLAAARGEFVAICEGDDYWTDPAKIAAQVKYLRANEDCVGCFHEASIVDAAGTELQPELYKAHVEPANRQEKYDRGDCLLKLMSRYATCSLMFRRLACQNLPTWYISRSNDFVFDLVITEYGKLGFIDRRMGAYRYHLGGVWTSQSRVAQIIESVMRFKHLLNVPYFFDNFREEIFAQIDTFQRLLVSHGEYAELQRKFDQQTAALHNVMADRQKLLAFVERQHALINGGKKAAFANTGR